MTAQDMYMEVPEFREYVHRFILDQERRGNLITVDEALRYAIVGEYAAWLKIHLNLK